MPVEQKYIDAAREQLAAQLKAKHPQMNDAQFAEAFAKCLANEAVERSMLYAGDVWPSTPVRVNELIDIALADSPELTKPDPGAEAVAEHLLAKSLEVFGRERIGELRVDAYRRAQAMSPQERIATGVDAPPPAQVVSEGSPTKAVPLHAQPYSWSGWDAEVSRITGVHPANTLPSKRREIIDRLKAESAKAANNGMHHKDVAALRDLDSRDPASLSPAEKITQARLRAHN